MSIIRGSNIKYKEESNFNILSKDTKVWQGELPYTTGCSFPTRDIKERANISFTNRLIYQNDTEEIFNYLLSILPETDIMYGYRIKEITSNLPYFMKAVQYWVGLVAGEAPIVDGSDDVDIKVNEIIDNSNWASMIQNEIRSRFLDTISAYRVDVDIQGKPTIVAIEPKNLDVYVSEEFPTSIEVVVVFNIFSKNNNKYVEFVEYHYDGLIKKTVYEYCGGKLGKHIEELDEETLAFDGKFKMSPIVVFKHNAVGNEIYGTDQFRYWIPSMISAMRELQNIFRLCEKTRDRVLQVPDSSIRKDPGTGGSYYTNRGVIGVSESNKEVASETRYITPNIPMEEAIKAFDKAVKCISQDTSLGPVFFDLEKLGTNLSAKSIEAALYPTKLESKRITSEMLPSLKELVVKLCALANIDLPLTSFNVMMFDGFPKDNKEFTETIQKRLNDDNSTITLEDAIQRLDNVPSRQAKQKAKEIKISKGLIKEEEENTVMFTGDDGVELNKHDVAPTANEVETDNVTEQNLEENLFESEMLFKPRNIQLKGGKRACIQRRLRQKGLE